MATKEIASPSEVSLRRDFQPARSRPQALREWAEFLSAPKEVGPMRLFMLAHHGATPKAFRMALLEESGTRRLFVTVLDQVHSVASMSATVKTPADAVTQGATPPDLAGFAAHILRDRFPADIEAQIEQAWD